MNALVIHEYLTSIGANTQVHVAMEVPDECNLDRWLERYCETFSIEGFQVVVEPKSAEYFHGMGVSRFRSNNDAVYTLSLIGLLADASFRIEGETLQITLADTREQLLSFVSDRREGGEQSEE